MAHPWIDTVQQPPMRTGNSMTFSVLGWGYGTTGHTGTADRGDTNQETSLYRNGSLVAGSHSGSLEASVPKTESAYRLVSTTAQTEGYPCSTATRTEWAFPSAQPGKGATVRLPLLQRAYSITGDGAGKTDRTGTLRVSAAQISGVPTRAVHTDRVELSYDDGATWQREVPVGTAHGVRVRLHAPPGASFLSLRVHASDPRGDTVQQTVVRAVGLR